MAKHATATDEKDHKKVDQSGYKIPVIHISSVARPDLEDQGIQVKMVDDTEEHHIVLVHGPNHPGHPDHRVAFTFVSDFSAKSGNPLLILSGSPTDAEIAAQLHSLNEELAPGAYAKARDTNPGVARDQAISKSFGPVEEVGREVQEYEDADGKTQSRVVIEFKPRRKLTRKQHAAQHKG